MLLSVQACGPAAALRATRDQGTVAWNGRLVVSLGAPIDPLTVTGRSVAVTDDAGATLPVLRRVEGDQLVVLLELDAARLASPPVAVTVTLLGLPSIHALASRDGRRLSRTTGLTFPLRASLDGSGPPVLSSVNGRSLEGSSADTIPFDDEVYLVMDGVVDPASVSPASCRLVPVTEGLQLTPVEPEVRWRLAGERFELWLRPPEGTQRLELHTRRLGLAGLGGDPVEPLLLQLTLEREQAG